MTRPQRKGELYELVLNWVQVHGIRRPPGVSDDQATEALLELLERDLARMYHDTAGELQIEMVRPKRQPPVGPCKVLQFPK